MNIIVYDFEVYKYDTLFGAKILNKNENYYFQTWDLEKIKKFYFEHINDIYVGYNNNEYDDLIYEAIVNDVNPKIVNDKIIREGLRKRCQMQLYSFDVMKNYPTIFSLKASEAAIGKSIYETSIPFDIDRHLTEDEKLEVEKYNRADLDQTEFNFNDIFYTFKLRIGLIKMFNLSLTCLNATGTSLAAKCLGAVRKHGIENMIVKPVLYDTLQLQNKELINYFLNNEFRTDKKLTIHVGNAEIQCGSGGAHSAIRKYHTDHFLYFDVSGYYNLIMINYNLLPRTMDETAKKKYVDMYYEQLRLKKIDPDRRGVYKTILLSVFGAMMNKYTDFYDPWNGLLVTITGQLFIVDLLEKLKDLVIIIQTNTDGIMVEPKNWDDKDKIINLVNEWMNRTGFVIKIEEKFNMWQRDVNCYICQNDKNEVESKGEVFKNCGWISTICSSKEPYIISKGVEAYFAYNVLPADFVEKNKNDLCAFQYICKKLSYDYLTFDVICNNELKSSSKIQNVNRAFAAKYDGSTIGTIVKHKWKGNKETKARVQNLPDNVIVWNDEILSNDVVESLSQIIDYNYYINRIYERICEFMTFTKVKDINL